MAATPKGDDQITEPTPQHVVYRRFASETRTVEVTSTAPWAAVVDLRPESEKRSLTFPNRKEQLDQVLKWTSEHPCINKSQGDSQNSVESKSKSKDDESRNHINQDNIPSPVSEKSPTKPILNLGSNQDKSNIYKSDSPFGGRKLSLAQRDKVVGGAAMTFAEPLISRASTNGERRKSEYDIGRLSSTTSRPETRRLTEPTIEEQKIPSTLNVSHQPTDSKFTFKTESKRTSSVPGTGMENTESIGDKASLQSKSNKSGFHNVSDKSLFKTEPKVPGQGSIPFSRSQTTRFNEPNCEKDKNQSSSNAKESSSENTRIGEARVEENKLQYAPNASGVCQQSDKSTLKSEPDVTLRANTAILRTENTKRNELDKIQSTSNAKVTTSFTSFDKNGESKIEENKIQTTGTPKSSGFSQSDRCMAKTDTVGSALGSENKAMDQSKTKNGSLFQQTKDKITFQNEPKSSLQGRRPIEDETKIKDNQDKPQSNTENGTSVTKNSPDKPPSKTEHDVPVKKTSEKQKSITEHGITGTETSDKPQSNTEHGISTTKIVKDKSQSNTERGSSVTKTSTDKTQSSTEHGSSVKKTSPDKQQSNTEHDISQTKTFTDKPQTNTEHDTCMSVTKTSTNTPQGNTECGSSVKKTSPEKPQSTTEHGVSVTKTSPEKTPSVTEHGISGTKTYTDKPHSNTERGSSVTKTSIDKTQSNTKCGSSVKKTSPDKPQSNTEHIISMTKTSTDKPQSNIEHGTSVTKTSTDKPQSNNEHGSCVTKTSTNKSVSHQSRFPNCPVDVSNKNSTSALSKACSLDTTKVNQDKLLSSHVQPTNDSASTLPKETSKDFELLQGPNFPKTTKPDIVPRKTMSSGTDGMLNRKTTQLTASSKADADTEEVSTLPKVTCQKKTSSEKSITTSVQPSPLSATAQLRPGSPKVTKIVRSILVSLSSQPKSSHDRHLIDTKVNGETDRNRSVSCSSKHEPPQATSGELVTVRPVTRSKSDVGEGNTRRIATATARKSCAERRCCGARSRASQETAAPARARSLSRLSRGPPMGSSASLSPKNKSSWTTQRALEAEVQQLKRELQMHKAEELRLHREIHKLRSVLQQATSFGEEKTGLVGDPDDGALLASLQDRHGMAGAVGPPGGASKKQGVSGESCEPESILVPRHEKDMKSRHLIKAAILDNDFLKNLARCQIRELVDCMYPQRVLAGSYVIREGEAGSHLYVLAEGEMEVMKEGTVLGRMGPGKAFGELAILYNCTRTASIRAVCDLQVWVLDRRAFQQIMMRTGMQRLEDNIAFLRSVPLLRGLDEQTLARIADALEPEFYPSGEYIVRQGARGNTFFIISGGSVEVTQRGGNGDELVLRTLERGDYFGEQALLHDDCRTASVRALPPGVDCLTLDRESFNALIGSLSELHHKDYAEDTRSQSSRTSFVNDCRKEDEAVASFHLEDLQPLGTLGVGGFGCVRLVMAPNGRSYALKCLSKRHVAATGQQEHVAAERDVLLAARSPFIVRLLRTFRDEANVYLLLEACLGGEVWALLREHERLPDKAARFIAASVLEALEYLHSRDIVYRDLKPENLVMDANGYVKLVDFGFCKRLPNGCKTWTFCGTPEYVAPEVILNRGHDRAVDYWAFGVLIFELLTGAPPFASTDPMGTYNLILLGMESAVMPKYISRPATHLIRRLCRAAPSERLGYQRGSFREVKAHRWFQNLDWDALRAQTMTPPIKPQVSGPADMSNFYPQTLDEELAPTELSHWDADF